MLHREIPIILAETLQNILANFLRCFQNFSTQTTRWEQQNYLHFNLLIPLPVTKLFLGFVFLIYLAPKLNLVKHFTVTLYYWKQSYSSESPGK